MKVKILVVILISFCLFTVYALWADRALSERTFEISDEKIGEAFDGFTIVQISDLHNATFGEGNVKLLSMIKNNEPDIIVVTGDVVDSRRTNIEIAKSFFKKALEIAPVYYVTGNHEARIGDNYDELYDFIKESDVTLLENEKAVISKGEDEICICGITDPSFASDVVIEEEFIASRYIDGLFEKGSFNILLAHKPEFFEIYAEEGFDLVFSGHAHGGQFRFPFVGGLIAPGQGIFPKYDSGLYEKDNTSMIVSRGIGNSIIPLRLFNRPEIITVKLKAC